MCQAARPLRTQLSPLTQELWFKVWLAFPSTSFAQSHLKYSFSSAIHFAAVTATYFTGHIFSLGCLLSLFGAAIVIVLCVRKWRENSLFSNLPRSSKNDSYHSRSQLYSPFVSLLPSSLFGVIPNTLLMTLLYSLVIPAEMRLAGPNWTSETGEILQ